MKKNNTTRWAHRRVLKNIASLFSLKGFDIIVPLLVTPYLVRTVGIENFGLIAFSLSFSAYFSSIINYGFNVTAARDISRFRDNTSEISKIYSETMFSIMGLAFGSLVIASFLIVSFPPFNNEKALFFGAFALTAMQSALPTWFFAGHERMSFIAILGVISKIFYIASLLLVVKNEDDYVYVNLLYAASAAATLMSSFLIIKVVFKVNFKKVGVKNVIASYRMGFPIFLTQFAPVFYNNSSTFMLGFFSTASAVGIYSAAMKVVEVFTTVGRLVASAFLPYIAVDIRRHRSFSKMMVLLGTVATIFMLISSDMVAIILFAENGSDIAGYLRWLSIGILFGFVYLTYGVNYLALTGNEKVAAKISVLVSLFGFLLLIMMVPSYGLVAVVFVFLLSRALLSGMSVFWYFKLENSR